MQNNRYLLVTSYLTIVTYLICITSCSMQDLFNRIPIDYLQSLSTSNSCTDTYIVIPINEEEEIITINEAFRQIIYEQYYFEEYPDYYIFLETLYNRKIKNMNNYISGYTYMDKYNSIIKEYKLFGLNYIIKNYLDRVNISDYTFKEKTENAVIKILFINGYYIYFDDYAGKYYFSTNCQTSN